MIFGWGWRGVFFKGFRKIYKIRHIGQLYYVASLEQLQHTPHVFSERTLFLGLFGTIFPLEMHIKMIAFFKNFALRALPPPPLRTSYTWSRHPPLPHARQSHRLAVAQDCQKSGSEIEGGVFFKRGGIFKGIGLIYSTPDEMEFHFPPDVKKFPCYCDRFEKCCQKVGSKTFTFNLTARTDSHFIGMNCIAGWERNTPCNVSVAPE